MNVCYGELFMLSSCLMRYDDLMIVMPTLYWSGGLDGPFYCSVEYITGGEYITQVMSLDKQKGYSLFTEKTLGMFSSRCIA